MNKRMLRSNAAIIKLWLVTTSRFTAFWSKLVIVYIHLDGNGERFSEYSMDVVAMGTGSKCIGKSKMSNQGNALSRGVPKGAKVTVDVNKAFSWHHMSILFCFRIKYSYYNMLLLSLKILSIMRQCSVACREKARIGLGYPMIYKTS